MRFAIVGHVDQPTGESFEETAGKVVPLIERAVDDYLVSPGEILTGRSTPVDRAAVLFAEKRGLPVLVFDSQSEIIAHADSVPVVGHQIDEPIAQAHGQGKRIYVAPDRRKTRRQ